MRKPPFPDEPNGFAKVVLGKLDGFSKVLTVLSKDVNEAAHRFLYAVIKAIHSCIVLITIWTLIKTLFAEVIRFAV